MGVTLSSRESCTAGVAQEFRCQRNPLYSRIFGSRPRYAERMRQTLEGLRATVITVSDRSFHGQREDLSGPAARRVLEQAGMACASVVTPDELELIAQSIRDAAASSALVVTTGGTGLAPRDVTPEATLRVCERLVPGLAERMRAEGQRQTPFSVLSRGVCGTLGRALVLNLPGSPSGAEGSLQAVLPLLGHALGLLAGDTEHDGKLGL